MIIVMTIVVMVMIMMIMIIIIIMDGWMDGYPLFTIYTNVIPPFLSLSD